MGKGRISKLLSSILIVTSSLTLLTEADMDFGFPYFNQTNQNNIATKGDANVVENRLYLTKSTVTDDFDWSFGWAVYKNPITLWSKRSKQLGDFQTQFQFIINNRLQNSNNLSSYADGLAFFMAPFGSEPPTNCSGMWLGLFNETTNGRNSTQTVAVEFDTFKNANSDGYHTTNPHDPNDNHVGIDVNNITSVKTHLLTPDLRLNGNITWNAWVQYNGTEKMLQVFLAAKDSSRPSKPILSYGIDLSEYLPEKVLVGFSASTGLSHQLHSIISWRFSIQTPWTDHAVKLYIIIIIFCLVAVSAMLFLLLYVIRHMKARSYRLQNSIILDREIDLGVQGWRAREYKYKELRAATNNFNEDQKLGEGGFGSVYKGILNDSGETLAVKRISAGSQQGSKEYLSEVTIIGQLRHRNLVPLLGWCHERPDELLLVYKFMSNGSLDKFLFRSATGPDPPVQEWKVRYKIACDLALVLMYLHDEFEQRVVHRDIKSSNIMLDSEFQAKLGDFGLARIIEDGHTSLFTAPSGTQGYLALECVMAGVANAETDVFSFGVVCLEIACGKPALYGPGSYWPLAEWVWDLYGENRLLEAADDKLNGEFDAEEMNQLMVVGLWCCHPECKQRPKIRQVLQTLKLEAPLPSLPPTMPRLLPFHHEWPSNSSCCCQFHDSVPRAVTDPGLICETSKLKLNVGEPSVRVTV